MSKFKIVKHALNLNSRDLAEIRKQEVRKRDGQVGNIHNPIMDILVLVLIFTVEVLEKVLVKLEKW